MVFTNDSSREPAPNTSPAGLVEAYAHAVTHGDVDALERLYEPAAVLVPVPGTALAGAARTQACVGFVRMSSGPMQVTLRHAYHVGDLALLIVDWAIEHTAGSASPSSLGGTATDIARCGADGLWRYVIDNPSGGAKATA